MSFLDLFRALIHTLRSRHVSTTESDRELQSHLDAEAQDQQDLDISPKESRHAARRAFGNVTAVREQLYESDRWLAWDHFWLDVRFAARTLRKSPGFAAVAILTIALGIGATTAIFSVVNAALLRPLPYPNAEQLVSIQDDLPGSGAQDVGMSTAEWNDLLRSGIFEYVSPTWFDENNLTGSSKPARVRITIGSPNYFALLGVKPQLGRVFDPDDNSSGILPEVVISDGLWKRAFGADPRILEKNVRLDTDLYRIVGVMPPGFDAPGRMGEERNIEVWAATNFHGSPLPDQLLRTPRILPTSIARLKSGLSLPAAQSRVDAFVAATQKQFPQDYPIASGWRIRLLPLKERVVGNVRQSLLLLLCAVGLVLLIGCVNVANLLLARASVRGREIALRQALGAARTRLISQLLTESLLLALIGGLVGLSILYVSKPFLLRLVPDSLPRLNELAINWNVLLFAFAASLCTGVIFGLIPALQASRTDLVHALKEATRGSTGSGQKIRLRHFLVAGEFALSLILMTAAGLLLHSFWELLNVHLGFRPDNVVAVRTRIPAPNFPENDLYRTTGIEAPFLREILRRARALPGVEEAAMGDPAAVPLDENLRNLKQISEGQYFFTLEDKAAKNGQPEVAERSSVTDDYLHLLGLSLLQGRAFTADDNENSPYVAVVNTAFAHTFWPGQNPLGKRFRNVRADSPWITVIGEIADARTESPAKAAAPQIYLSLYQSHERRLTIFVRGHNEPAALAEQIREQVQAVDPTLPVTGPQTLTQTVSASLSERRFSVEIIASFAFTALLLAGLGIYGVISYIVGERTHEIGIRMALGAERRNIIRLVVSQGLGISLAGAAVGLFCALFVSRFLAGLLYGVNPSDPITFTTVAAVLFAVAFLACYVPALKATRVDPMAALRHD